LVPVGAADTKRVGSDITVVANHLMLHRALEVAEMVAEQGIDVEVIDPRTIVPFDTETVEASVRKTRRLLVVEENHRRGGWGGWLIAEIVERCPELAPKVMRVALPDAPVPFSPVLESAVVPSTGGIENAIVDLMKR
jgi:pyruvate dehydrogenase E1 component beta subunit